MKVLSGCFVRPSPAKVSFSTRTARRSFQRVGASTRMSSMVRTQKSPMACTRSAYPEAFRASASQKARSSSSRVDAISCIRAQSSTP